MDDVLPGLNDALKAINRGDVEPAVALLDPDVDWRGRPRGHLWWRQTPSCHGPDEARRNLALQVDKGQARPGIKRFALEQVAQVSECVVVAGRWTMADGSREDAGRFYQVLRVRAGHPGLHQSPRRDGLRAAHGPNGLSHLSRSPSSQAR